AWQAIEVFDADIRVLASAAAPLSRRGAHLLHAGTAEVEAQVRPLEGTVPPGSSGLARVRLAQRLPLAPGDRFVLRDTGRAATIGGGRVLDITPPRRGLRARAAGLDRRRAALDAGDTPA